MGPADFSQTPDEEVIDLLARAAAAAPSPRPAAADPLMRDEEVEVTAGPVRLAGHLTVPDQAVGAVVFAHGSGSSRHSPRNRYVAAVLNDARLATLLFDLLTRDEEHDRAKVFNVDLLAHRVAAVTTWLRAQPEVADLPVGCFGASTGAAAAFAAAAEPGADVAAIVSRGGRPDLAERWLQDVVAPTLLIVGGRDDVVLTLNRRALARLAAPDSRLAIVPGATHLCEEPGCLGAVADLARGWFIEHLASHAHDAGRATATSGHGPASGSNPQPDRAAARRRRPGPVRHLPAPHRRQPRDDRDPRGCPPGPADHHRP